jgi:hypothetical protein
MKQITDAQHLDILASVKLANDYAMVVNYIIDASNTPAVATIALRGLVRELGQIETILEIDDDDS